LFIFEILLFSIFSNSNIISFFKLTLFSKSFFSFSIFKINSFSEFFISEILFSSQAIFCLPSLPYSVCNFPKIIAFSFSKIFFFD
jgi:hypothetical protein